MKIFAVVLSCLMLKPVSEPKHICSCKIQVRYYLEGELQITGYIKDSAYMSTELPIASTNKWTGSITIYDSVAIIINP